MSQRYTVVESIRYVHKASGRTYSPYGAWPWTAWCARTAADYERRVVGFTIRDNLEGTVGLGRAPFGLKSEAESFADALNAKYRQRVAEAKRDALRNAPTVRLTRDE